MPQFPAIGHNFYCPSSDKLYSASRNEKIGKQFSSIFSKLSFTRLSEVAKEKFRRAFGVQHREIASTVDFAKDDDKNFT